MTLVVPPLPLVECWDATAEATATEFSEEMTDATDEPEAAMEAMTEETSKIDEVSGRGVDPAAMKDVSQSQALSSRVMGSLTRRRLSDEDLA